MFCSCCVSMDLSVKMLLACTAFYHWANESLKNWPSYWIGKWRVLELKNHMFLYCHINHCGRNQVTLFYCVCYKINCNVFISDINFRNVRWGKRWIIRSPRPSGSNIRSQSGRYSNANGLEHVSWGFCTRSLRKFYRKNRDFIRIIYL